MENHCLLLPGNFTKIPQMECLRNFPEGSWIICCRFSKIRIGHDNVVNWARWLGSRILILKEQNGELIASGFRNPFDLAFNDAGDMLLTIRIWSGILVLPGIAQREFVMLPAAVNLDGATVQRNGRRLAR
jgi:hypothetical protein